MKLGKLLTVTALATGVALGTFVDSAEAFLPPGPGWGWGSVSNSGNDPNPPENQNDTDQRNIGFDLLFKKNNQVINSTQKEKNFIFKGAIENFFYREDDCDDGNCVQENDILEFFDIEKIESFDISFDVGDLIAQVDENGVEYTISSSNIQQIINNQSFSTTGQNEAIATFRLDGINRSSLFDIETTVDQFYEQLINRDSNNPAKAKTSNQEIRIKENYILDGGVGPSVNGDLTIDLTTGEIKGGLGTFSFQLLESNSTQTTPESDNIISLIVLGFIGSGMLLKKNK